MNKEKLSDLGRLRFKLDLNLTFPYIKVNGTYKVDGLIGDTFMIHGNGPFWYVIYYIYFSIDSYMYSQYLGTYRWNGHYFCTPAFAHILSHFGIFQPFIYRLNAPHIFFDRIIYYQSERTQHLLLDCGRLSALFLKF